MDWVIVGVCGKNRKDENDHSQETTIKNWEKLELNSDDGITIENLKTSFLCDYTQKEQNCDFIVVSRCDICKIYTLIGLKSDDMIDSMDIFDDILKKTTGEKGKYYFKLENIPFLVFFPLTKLKFAYEDDIQHYSLLREKYKLLVRILSYLYGKKDVPWVILISGTSGSGKSTISSHLSYYLKVKYILQTDSIRHILASTSKYKDEKSLHYSSYQVHKCIDNKEFNYIKNESETEEDLILNGYLLQSYKIEDYIFGIIENHINNNKSIIVEGVHITPRLFERIKQLSAPSGLNKNNKARINLFTFLIYIQNPDEHIQRFYQRGKGLLDSKYSSNIHGIREIQNYLLSTVGKEYNVECIDNTSNDIDKIMQHLFEHLRNSFFSVD
ncbi:phosphoglycerate kinase family protein [Cryptosporidium ryanae]|uniref:phosphoglycerate kinase family protein n=1 Tax=Cryptosporidium ryanae TaxID=515981 RepID=UPI00351A2E09|nr:phosphoglycerate kinase family protein [Cryptosporidium ryanae]